MEKDAQLLANRISLLRQEELRTRKKIDETKKKSKEIMAKKSRLEEKQMVVLSVGYKCARIEGGDQGEGAGGVDELPARNA